MRAAARRSPARRGRLFAQDALAGLRLLDLTRERFDVVVMNPPFGALSVNVKAQLGRAYPRSKHDLLAIFVERGLELLRPRRKTRRHHLAHRLFSVQLSSDTSYRRWREEIVLGNAEPEVMADLGHGVMDDAMVEAAAYVVRKRDDARAQLPGNMSQDLTKPPAQPVGALIVSVIGDHCELDLGEYGRGRLRQSDSRARNERAPLEELAPYAKGRRLRVILHARHRETGTNPYWFVNERWADDNPWPNLEERLPVDRVVTGTVMHRTPHGWFVQLDQVDIEAWLSERTIPWCNGDTGREPLDEHMLRLELDLGDRVKAVLTQIRRPPENPDISINALLDRRRRDEQAFIERPTMLRDPTFQLGHRVRIDGDSLDALLARLRQRRPLTGNQLLLIDDDKQSLDALTDLLRLNGARVDPYHSEKYPGLRQLAEAIADAERYDLVLVDYSLPRQGEGLTLAGQLQRRFPSARIALFTGEVLDIPQAPGTAFLAGVLRKPVRLDSLLRVLSGEPVWQVEGLAPLDIDVAPPQGNGRGAADLVRDAFDRMKRLRYLVLLRPLTQLRIVCELRQGQFAPDTDMAQLVQVTDIARILKGYRRTFAVGGENPGNLALKRYARHGRFEAIGTGAPPQYIVGLGWDNEQPPFEKHELDAFMTLLEARLEHAALLRWVQERVPFMMLGQVFVGLGHEIRNRFGPWLNHQDTLRLAWSMFSTAPPEQRAALAAEIERALEGMGAAYDGLHDLVDLMLTRLRGRAGPTNVRQVMEEMRRLFEQQLRSKGIRYEDVGKPPECSLGLPALYLVQPLSNLLLNVYKHMHREHDGWVRVQADLAQTADAVVVTVEDNGPGIPHAVLPRLFEPGFSLAPDPTQRTGMGLYVSRLLLSEIGGLIDYDWTWRGVGTRFRIELPLTLEA